MCKRSFLLAVILLPICQAAFCDTIAWVATAAGDNNMEETSSWSPQTVPSAGDVAVFNSLLPGLNLTPSCQATDFQSGEFNFSASASVFTFSFLNSSLTFDGDGITGTATDATLNLTNTDNTSDLSNQLTFSGSTPSSGSATINVTNSGTAAGEAEDSTFSELSGSQIAIGASPFSIANDGQLIMVNTGVDSTTNAMTVHAGYSHGSQMECHEALTAGNNVTISASNQGTSSSTNSGSSSSDIGYIADRQLYFDTSASAMSAGNYLSLIASNVGSDNSLGTGSNSAGYVGSSQMEFSFSCDFGDNTTITLMNSGTNSGTNLSAANNNVGYVGDAQLNFQGDTGSEIGDYFTLTATNQGNNSSIGEGNHRTGYVMLSQVYCNPPLSLGDHTTITITNSGIDSGSASNSENFSGYIDGQQFFILDNFSVGSDLEITISNTGTDSSSGNANLGGNTTGYLAGHQFQCNNNFSFGSNATITMSNQGINSGNGISAGNQVGYAGGSQFFVFNNFGSTATPSDSFTFTATNIGEDSSNLDSGINDGGHQVGYLDGAQMQVPNGYFAVGEDATLSFSNEGTCSGNSSAQGKSVGYMSQWQMFILGNFYAEDNLLLTASNLGTDSSAGSSNVGGNQVGYVGSSQLQCNNVFSFGDNASIELTNHGVNSGNTTTSGSQVGYVNGQQLLAFNGLGSLVTPRGSFTLTATNIGEDSSSGDMDIVNYGDNQVGYLSGIQVLITNSNFSFGNSATITLSNEGTISGNATHSSDVGFINQGQLLAINNFSVNNTGHISCSNIGTDSSGGSNNVGGNKTGYVGGIQIQCNNLFSVGANTIIEATNHGINSGNGTTDGNQTGWANGGQFYAFNGFGLLETPSNSLTLTLTNIGEDSSAAGVDIVNYGGHQVGFLNGPQAAMTNGGFFVGDDATISLSNQGISSGNASEASNQVGYLGGGQVYIQENFSANDNLQMSVSNEGIDSSGGSTNIGGNQTGYVLGAQLQINNTYYFGDHASVTVTNNGTNSGNGLSAGNSVGYLSASQFYVYNALGSSVSPSDYFTLTVTNIGNDSSAAGDDFVNFGGNQVSYVNGGQVGVYNGDFTVGDYATLSISNQGTNSGNAFSDSNSVGYVAASQIYTAEDFSANDELQISLSNIGVDSSGGASNVGGNQVGYVFGYQLGCLGSFYFGDNATITTTNHGTNSGNGISAGNQVGYISASQFSAYQVLGSSEDPKDYFTLTVANIGEDSSSASIEFINNGGNQVGYISANQVDSFNGSYFFGDHTTLSISNQGTSSGNASLASNFVGSISGSQLYVQDAFSANDYLQITISNLGNDSSGDPDYTGYGGNQTGHIEVSQLNVAGAFSFGDHSTIAVTNQGTNSGYAITSGQIVGNVNQAQLLVGGAFGSSEAPSDYFTLTVTNIGEDSSSGENNVGGNHVGYLGAIQLQMDDNFSVGDQATITLSNRGTNTGYSISGNSVGYVTISQLLANNPCSVGNYFTLSVSNEGTDTSTSTDGNSVGFVNNDQVTFYSTLTVGDEANISVSNSGTNSGSALDSFIGYIGGSQFVVIEAFSAGAQLQLSAVNSRSNTGSATNVGIITDTQIFFVDTCSMGNDSVVMATNSGTVQGDAQIFFGQGFDITSGQATIQAVNTGTIAGEGILIQGDSSGGNANIVLENSSLSVNTNVGSYPSFTIRALDGDSLSSANSLPTLNIDTESGVSAEFAGVISDFNFPTNLTALTKTGTGSQKLSGDNTYTGLTTIQQGTLIVSGSVAGDVSIASSGTLKGGGVIGGSITNAGTIAPGESIGTLTVVGNFTNNGGGYDVEVNGDGDSDLIDVGGVATLSGGEVLVSSVDGTYRYQSPYTILDAASVVGTYGTVDAISPMLQPVLSYDSQHVYLTIETAIINAATTKNQIAIATQLDNITDPTAQQTELLDAIVELTIPEAQEALNTLSGYQHASDLLVTEMINRQFIRRLYDPVRFIVTDDCCCRNYCCTSVSSWIELSGTYMNFNKNNNVQRLNFNGYEITAGLQSSFCSDWTVGVGGSYANSKAKFNDHNGNENINTWLVGLYGLYRPQGFYGLVDVTYGYSYGDLKRVMDIGDLQYKARSHPVSQQVTFYGELGVDWHLCCVLVQPFAGLEIGGYRRNHVTEKGSDPVLLSVNRRHQDEVTSRIGVHMTSDESLEEIGISLDLAWNKRLNGNSNRFKEAFVEFGDTFSISGVPLDENSIDYALTLSKDFEEWGCVYLKGSGESWSKGNVYGLLAGFQFSW